MSATAAYTIPAEPGRYGALLLALVMHLALVSFLWVGIRWQNDAPVAVEAEVWDTKIREAAPKAVPPPPPVEVKPEPKPEPRPETPPKAEVRAPDLVLERELKLEKKHKEKLATEEKKKKEEELAKLEAEKQDKKKREKLEKAEKAKEAAKHDKAEKDKLDKLHADQMARITGSGASTSTSDSPRSTGPRGDPNYAQAIRAKIKSSLSFGGDSVAGNPKAVFKIDLLPSGEVLAVKLLKSSGIPAFDDAVEKAINKASPLPKKKDGSVDRDIEVTYNLKE